MNVILILFPLALLISLGFGAVFVWAAKNGQFDDLETPAERIIIEGSNEKKEQQ